MRKMTGNGRKWKMRKYPRKKKRKNGRRKRKRAPWVNVATAERGVETGRKGAMPVAEKD